MSTFTDAMAYDARRVHFNTSELAETVQMVPTGSPAASVRVIWGRVEKADTGSGYIADTATVSVLGEDMEHFETAFAPERGRNLEIVRYPAVITGREVWYVSDVSRLDANVWELRVWKLPEAKVLPGA